MIADFMKDISEANKLLEPLFFGSEQVKKGIELLESAVEKGSIEALYMLGKEYETGWCISKDIEKAIDYYQEASDRGHIDATVRLSYIYYNNDDMDKQTRKEIALKLLEKVTDTCNGPAMYLKGLIYWHGYALIDYYVPKALDCLEKAAYDGEHVGAMLFLGSLYENGYQGNCLDFDFRYVPQKSCVAARLYKMASDRGNPEGHHKYASLLLAGKGVSEDYTEAFLLLWKSAIKGNGFAQLDLANFYVSEKLFPCDYKTALLWTLISQTYQSTNETQTLLNALIKQISKAEVINLQKTASSYKSILSKAGTEATPLLQEPNSYLSIYMFKEGNDTLSFPRHEQPVILSQKPNTLTIDACESTSSNEVNEFLQDTRIEASQDIIQPTDTKEYKYSSTVKQTFDISKVELELEIGRKLAKREEPDYTKLRIKYDGKLTDCKTAKTYEGIRVNQSSRKLLLCLACQTSTTVLEKRSENIIAILHKAKSDDASRLNTMLLSMFPNCGLSNKSCMINKAKGLIHVKLTIKDPLNKLDTNVCEKCQYHP